MKRRRILEWFRSDLPIGTRVKVIRRPGTIGGWQVEPSSQAWMWKGREGVIVDRRGVKALVDWWESVMPGSFLLWNEEELDARS